ncbi:MAG: PrsW family glutamic-type intramembrane protease [Rubripirellula sp.]|nr:PrsW family glutamic-type intramembrane protease [Rubripirellula sp.]
MDLSNVEIIPLLLSLVPTLVLMGLVGAFRFSRSLCPVLWMGIALGVVACVPVWLMETVVEGAGDQLSGVYEKAFIQQVLGAAVSEELFIFLGFLIAFFLFRHSRIKTDRDVVAIAVAAAIGFTTVENLTAVLAAESPMTTAFSRLLSIVAGHASLQLMMGFFAAKVLLGREHRALYGFLMLAVPIVIHGWGDFSEAVFQAVDPDSQQSKQFFSGWILGIFAYIAGATVVLFKLHESTRGVTLDASDTDDNTDEP